MFTVSVVGMKDEVTITTSTVDIIVRDSGYTQGEAPSEPTPSIYEQIIGRLEDIEDGIDGKDGYTPVRGTDYWTQEDIESMQNYIDNNSSFAEFTKMVKGMVVLTQAEYDALGEDSSK